MSKEAVATLLGLITAVAVLTSVVLFAYELGRTERDTECRRGCAPFAGAMIEKECFCGREDGSYVKRIGK